LLRDARIAQKKKRRTRDEKGLLHEEKELGTAVGQFLVWNVIVGREDSRNRGRGRDSILFLRGEAVAIGSC